MSVFGNPRPRVPETAMMDENVTKIEDLVLANRRLKVSEKAKTVDNRKNRVAHILHEKVVGAMGAMLAHSGQQLLQ